ncbi:hypothetical protein RHMOL_Rhmol12G0112000 [Rhododendron molle]|uniref:Uncharacterized protein n=1 Tax=Rhododendron molle TaxID=49168 RepID=A0ACC0LHT1_RHOML|nr:hypothetical protein RHMOL_Rhmol12G0112000 [Rhododendron molle]
MKTTRMDFGKMLWLDNNGLVEQHQENELIFRTKDMNVNELNGKNLLSGLKDEDWARVLAHLARPRGTSSLEATVSTGPWHHHSDHLQAFCLNLSTASPPPSFLQSLRSPKEVNKLYCKNQLSGLKDKDWARVLARLARRRAISSLEATVSTGPWHHR